MPLVPIAESGIVRTATKPVQKAAPWQDILTALREITAPAHQRLHHHAGLSALLHGRLSQPDHIGLLRRMLGLYDTIERRLAVHETTPWLAWYAERSGANWYARLRNDLAALGLPEAEIAAAAVADSLLLTWIDAAAALGCAWVVEGSALGGSLLACRAGAAWPNAATFFTPNADQNERWKPCCAAVERCGDDPGQRAAVLAGAAKTFAVYESWLGDLPW